jgi:transglutaminase-like putative cysteine protease
VSPSPVGLSEQLDIENNYMHLGWFEGMHSKMEIHAEFELISLEFNPFDFLVYPMNYAEVPFNYLGTSAKIVAPYLEHSKLDKQLLDFGNGVLSESKNTVDFISNATREIHNHFTVIERLTGEPYDPDKSFKLKEGSCRDIAWMQINLLRNFGIATRFVSGYCFIDSHNNVNDLHAWCEAYIPGAGWIGFDPSHGVLTANNYIPVASSAVYSNTMPVAGSVRGSATSELITDLNIEVVG